MINTLTAELRALIHAARTLDDVAYRLDADTERSLDEQGITPEMHGFSIGVVFGLLDTRIDEELYRLDAHNRAIVAELHSALEKLADNATTKG